MKKSLLGAALGAALLGVPVHAMAGGFVGLNYTQLEQNDRFFGDQHFDTGEVFARIGGHINEFVTTEMRVGTTVDKMQQGREEYRFNYHVGLYAELGYQFGALRPYVLLGYTYGEEVATLFNGVRYKEDTAEVHDTSFGAGVDLYLGDRLGLNVEYIQYYDIGDVTFKGPSAGVFYRF